MFKRLSAATNAAVTSEWLSGAAVIGVAGLVGAYAAEGMTTLQWISGLSAVAGAIAWAVMVRVWPQTVQS